MSRSNIAETVGVHIPKDIVRLIEARAEAIGHKKSRYAAMIIEWWMAQGAPAISKVDENMRAEVMSQRSAHVSQQSASSAAKKNPKTGRRTQKTDSKSGVDLGILKMVNGEIVLVKSNTLNSKK